MMYQHGCTNMIGHGKFVCFKVLKELFYHLFRFSIANQIHAKLHRVQHGNSSFGNVLKHYASVRNEFLFFCSSIMHSYSINY